MDDFDDIDVVTLEPPVELLQVPFSRQAEEALLGSILIDPEKLRSLDLQPGEFYIVRHRWIWEAMLAVQAEKRSLDFVTITDELIRLSRLKEVGGAAFLMSLINQTPTSLHAEAYARIIRDHCQRRRIVEAAQNAVASAMDRNKKVNDVIADATADLANIAVPNGGEGSQPYSFYLSRHYDRIAYLAEHPNEHPGMATGFKQYDYLTGGIYPSEFIIFYGKPKVRKTQFLQQLAGQLALAGHPGAFYQLETPEDMIIDRDISRWTIKDYPTGGITTERLERGKLHDSEWGMYTSVIAKYSGLPLYLNFEPQSTTSIKADASRLKAEYGIRWIMVDYMGLLQDEHQRGEDVPAWEARVARALKKLGRSTGLSVIVIHSLTKEGIKRVKPSTSDGSGGAGIPYDCDKSIFITEHIPEPPATKSEPNMRSFIFDLSRRAVKGRIFNMVVLPEFPMYSDPPPQKEYQSQDWTR